MKRGLHFGRRPARARALGRLLLVLLLAGACVLAVRILTTRRSAASLREEVVALRASAEAPEPAREDADGPRLARLGAVMASGAPEAFPPTELLELVAEALPDEARLTSLTLQASPPSPGITLEAVTRSAEAVTELQRQMAASPLVRATTVLDERRLPDGALAVRLQVDLDAGGLP